MRILGLYSIKGGVGKTAAAVNLAYLSAQTGRQTLLIDLDPQSASTYYFRIRSPKKHHAKKLVKNRKAVSKQIRGSDFERLDLLPADFSYRNLDLKLDQAKHSRRRLSDMLDQFEDEYDTILIDSPPNITLVSENIFRAVDNLLVPVIPTILSMRTLDSLFGFFNEQKLDGSKILPFFSMVERRKKLHRQIIEEHSINETLFLKSQIPYLADIEKMGTLREPVCHSVPDSAAARSFSDLWNEIMTTALM